MKILTAETEYIVNIKIFYENILISKRFCRKQKRRNPHKDYGTFIFKTLFIFSVTQNILTHSSEHHILQLFIDNRCI